jgi:hypothetical protein
MTRFIVGNRYSIVNKAGHVSIGTLLERCNDSMTLTFAIGGDLFNYPFLISESGNAFLPGFVVSDVTPPPSNMECKCEPVNVGFNIIKLVCKHCDRDM